ncbi:MAG: class I SAM-dependent methyltransferase, partial [Gillisia sp.]
MCKISTRKRTDESEIMDDFELKGTDLEKTLYDLDNINKWLGGNKITLQGIKILLKDHPKSETVHIADIGCGNGSILREIAKWGRKENYTFELTGIDANPYAIEIGEKLSYYYPEIKYYPVDIFRDEFEKMKFDILLCTLTLHHFKDTEIDTLVELFTRQS